MIMKIFATIILVFVSVMNLHAQLLRKMKDKAEAAINKELDKPRENKKSGDKEGPATGEQNGGEDPKAKSGVSNLKVYSKFDFVPGNTILYYDNFEKDNIGESPLGWITSTSAEVVTIEGMEGNWLKLASTSSRHITRNKKQSWGNNFTVEFDLLLVKNTYDPRLNISLINTGGNLVTDESILGSGKPAIYFESILGAEGKQSRTTLYGLDGKKFSDNMSENLGYNNSEAVHISMCVQGKRFRMWWNDKKLYDLAAVTEQYLPNQLGFMFGSVGGCEVYISNIRVAKDVPDTRARFEEGKLVSNLLFYTGTAKLKPESMGSLLDVSKILKEATSLVKILGHTDSDGDDAVNLKLSQQRAEAVKSILVTEYNIDASKLAIEGRGETQPLANNNTAEGKAQNRRVEFIFKAEADKYIKPSGVSAGNSTSGAGTNKPAANMSKPSDAVAGESIVKLQSKLLTTTLTYAQFMKTGESSYTFIASKEEGDSKKNYFKIALKSVNTSLKPETFNFKEINEKNPLYGTKKYAEISANEAVLYYGASQKPYIYQFSPIIANGTMASYVDESLAKHLPAISPNCKFVIEKVTDGKASGYFTMGIMTEGLKPVKKGDAMEETFTTAFAGELKCTFSNVPVY
jgi:outer membrane protein OmpA-like peptidoglycan-associated protein